MHEANGPNALNHMYKMSRFYSSTWSIYCQSDSKSAWLKFLFSVVFLSTSHYIFVCRRAICGDTVVQPLEESNEGDEGPYCKVQRSWSLVTLRSRAFRSLGPTIPYLLRLWFFWSGNGYAYTGIQLTVRKPLLVSRLLFHFNFTCIHMMCLIRSFDRVCGFLLSSGWLSGMLMRLPFCYLLLY
jgi:hypothetical protein